MTGREFIQKVCGYYGPYPSGQLPYVAKFMNNLERKYSARYLDFLFNAVLSKVESKYKSPPDICVLKSLHGLACDLSQEANRKEGVKFLEYKEDPRDPFVTEAKVRELFEELRIKLEEKNARWRGDE